ncbi:sugar phosphate isomerase/epimerase family protein [Brachybacterium alimentarium]|uniref:sugar phosphate isomerase/epimerase family protein n=1 Tax=Brachybacterium alimentarium TaxID=47845 RepID=UPI000DF2D2D4|nr:sugar phosphate isomerase/epimerase family protein [Brachybacterium alimentarium]RCS77247.1 sugar phosphate isomerase/epimerase [Brachybacterium alimentarium]
MHSPQNGQSPQHGRSPKHGRPPQYGVIAPDQDVDAILAAGADYIEPTIVGNVIVPDGDGDGINDGGGVGGWRANTALRTRAASPSFAVLVPGAMRLSDPDFPLASTRDYLRTALGAAADLARPGATVVLGSGAARRMPEGVDPDAARLQFARTVEVARDVGAEHGLEIVLEPLHRGETDLINTVTEAIDFLDEFGMGELRVVADLFHIMREGEPLEVIRARADRVAHAHIADSGRTPPGQGEWPLAEFLEALRGGGYRGHVSIECTWADVASEAGPALAAVRAADPAWAASGA